MEWIVLGSGTAVSRGPRSAASHAVGIGGAHLVFDSGSATLLRMGEAGIRFERLTDLFYTHLHPDHTADLAPLLFARNYAVEERVTPQLTLWGPEGLSRLLDGLRAAHGEWLRPRGYRLRVRVFPGLLEGNGWKLVSRPVDHVPGSIGYRIEAGGRVAAYSGDTGYCDGVVALCRDADLAVLECSFPDDRPAPGHLTPSQCGRIAREARARRLVLTHLYPACESIDVVAAAAREYDGEILEAHDLQRLEV